MVSGNVTIQELHAGVLFRNIGPIVYSSHKYSIEIHFNMSILKEQDDNLETDVNSMAIRLRKSSLGQSKFAETFNATLTMLHSEIINYEKETQTLMGLIAPQKRTPRAWVDGLGWVISKVTGLLDSDKGKEIDSEIAVLKARNEDLKMEVTSHKLLIKNMLNSTMAGSQVLASLAKTLSTIGGELTTIAEGEKLEGQLQLFSLWVARAKSERQKLRIGLERALRGELSPELVEPKLLKTILQKVDKELEKPLELLAPVEEGSIRTFYELSEIYVEARGETLVVRIKMPLRSDASDFRAVKIYTIPVFAAELKSYVRFMVQDFLLISEDFKFFTVLSKTEMGSCKEGTLTTVCPASKALLTSHEESCEFSLYSSMEPKGCRKQVILHFSETFEKVGEEWAFSVPDNTKLTINCKNFHDFQTISGTGIITGTRDCDLSTDRFHLLGGHMLAENVTTDWAGIRIPKLNSSSLLTDKERAAFQVDDDILTAVKDAAATAKNNIHLDEMLEKVTAEREKRQFSPSEIHLHGLSLITVVVIVGLVLLTIKLCRATSATLDGGKWEQVALHRI